MLHLLEVIGKKNPRVADFVFDRHVVRKTAKSHFQLSYTLKIIKGIELDISVAYWKTCGRFPASDKRSQLRHYKR